MILSCRRITLIVRLLILVLGFGASPALAVKVAVVKSFRGGDDGLAIMAELHNHWDRYGDIRVEIDRSLHTVSSFTYQNLVDTGADVLWISNPAGTEELYSSGEVAAVERYANEGHHVLGTFRVFRFNTTDNRELAPIFGLPETAYNIGSVTTEMSFTLLEPGHPLFRDLPDPYTSLGFNRAQVPNDDGSWGEDDFGDATVLAQTPDDRGVITFYQTPDYHAVYVSVFVEFVSDPVNADDTQFIYNVLTLDEIPTGECCVGDGTCEVVEQPDCLSGDWTQGGTCDPNPCPQIGACCEKGCFVGFEADCASGRWTKGIDCETDSDGDSVIDACDVCPGFDDFADDDLDGVPDGCDRCPDFDDAIDADDDDAPDACDICPGADDNLDNDNDGVPDGCDICPGSDDATDCDGDEVPDGCDSEPDCNGNGVPDNCDLDDGSEDCDGNGVPDECQPDADDDGIIDPCDACDGNDALIGIACDSPIDADDCRTGLYDCTTGTLTCSDDEQDDDVDGDGDGVYDCNDLCPGTPPGVIVRADGCRPGGACCDDPDACFDGVPPETCDAIGGALLGIDLTCDGDPDSDGFAGCDDGCPVDPTKSEPGQCGCGQPDTDTDHDAVADCLDGCPLDPNKTEPGVCDCGSPDVDSDKDGTLDCLDGCPDDPDKTEPGVCGCGAPDVDSDKDGTLDCLDGCPDDPDKIDPGVCGCGVPDDDSDNDGTFDCGDECPFDPEKITPGACGCGVVEDTSDDDADGVIGCFDLCPDTPPDVEVDEEGCPMRGACCFRGGIGVCIDDTESAVCIVFGDGGRYQGNGSNCEQGCAYPNNGDIDGNGRLDLGDLDRLTACLGGPDILLSSGNCDTYDFDTSNTVDLRDYAAFQTGLGPLP